MSKIERRIGLILRFGVGLSVLIICIGIISHLLELSYAGNILLIGIGILIFTPIIRIIASIYAFARQKDRLYVAITLTVLVILIVSMMVGFVI